MAITTTTITKSAGWARTDAIDSLEQAFTWLELHGSQISGLVTSISEYSGGGTVGSAGTDYYDVPVATTSGIGTGATFEVYRSSGVVNAIYVNRPGYGYTDGEYVTLSAEDIGGSANGAVAIGITVSVDGGVTPVGYGSTNAFFDKNFNPQGDSTSPWGVLKQDFDTNKRFGVTYRGFKVESDYQMMQYAGSSFFPYDVNNTSNRGAFYANSFRGTDDLDISSNVDSTVNSLDYANIDTYAAVSSSLFQFASSNSPTSHDLKLNIYRSSIDPSFAVLSFNQPSISGTLSDSTFSTFIIHNFNSDLWDLDEVFSAGITLIDKDPVENSIGAYTSELYFKTFLSGNDSISRRSAEIGWTSPYSNMFAINYNVASTQSAYTRHYVATGDSSYHSYTDPISTIYSRVGDYRDQGFIDSNNTYGNRYPITTYRSVIKGIPINGNLIPCPYYMPDDFVLIDLKLATSGQDILQGDTITVSGSEVYTVITGSYNKYNETAGIFFCARTV